MKRHRSDAELAGSKLNVTHLGGLTLLGRRLSGGDRLPTGAFKGLKADIRKKIDRKTDWSYKQSCPWKRTGY